MASEEKQEERGFTVVDKRGVADKGQDVSPEPGGKPAGDALPTVDFSSLCLSLGTSALYHLGAVGDPETGTKTAAPNLPLAQQTIDILEMLQRKTEGNLEAEEVRLLEGLLFELRMRFVEVRDSGGGADGSKGE